MDIHISTPWAIKMVPLLFWLTLRFKAQQIWGSWVGGQKMCTFCFPLHRRRPTGNWAYYGKLLPTALGSISLRLASPLEAWYTRMPCDQTRCVIERLHPRGGGFPLYNRHKWQTWGGVDGPAVRAAGSMGNWNQARDAAIGPHKDAGGHCANAIEAGVRADGLARILHTGTRSGRLGRAKSRTAMPT